MAFELPSITDWRQYNDIGTREAAIGYARDGVPVILLKENGKAPHPYVAKGWPSRATVDIPTINDWFDKFPDANIGIVPNERFVFLDLDNKNDGPNGVEEFQGLHEHVMGPSAVTPNTGVHRVFLRPEDPRLQRNFSPRKCGFDYMESRRLIVVAPSTITNSLGRQVRYRWTMGGMPGPMPKILREKIVELANRTRQTENDPAQAPETPSLGDIIPNSIKIDVSDRSHGAFAYARSLYIHHGDRSDSDIFATVWSIPEFSAAGTDRRETTESAMEWVWRYCVWPAEKARVNWPERDTMNGKPYDPRTSAEIAIEEGRPLAPWEIPNDNGATVNALDDITPLSKLITQFDKPPEFLIPKWIPKGVLTTLFGKDGTGKTMFMQRVCTCLASGKRILTRADGRRVRCMMILSEDTMPAIVDRQKKLCRQIGIDFSSIDGTLHIPANLMEIDVKMTTFDRNMTMQPTAFYKAIQRYVERERPELIVLDPISDIYADEENRREKVSQFMRSMNSLASQYNIAVVLIGHPAKAEGSEYSGSGAWSSKSRSRLFMQKVRDTPGSAIRLMHMKASYGAPADDVILTWQNEVLRDMEDFEQQEADEDMMSDMVRLIVNFIEEGYWNRRELFSDSPQSANRYLVRAMVDRGASGIYTADEIRRCLSYCYQSNILAPKVVFDGEEGRPYMRDNARRLVSGIWFPTDRRDIPASQPDDPDEKNDHGISENEAKEWIENPPNW